MSDTIESLAQRVRRSAGDDLAAQVNWTFRFALQRDPEEREKAVCMEFVQSHTLEELCRAILNINEFVYVQ